MIDKQFGETLQAVRELLSRKRSVRAWMSIAMLLPVLALIGSQAKADVFSASTNFGLIQYNASVGGYEATYSSPTTLTGSTPVDTGATGTTGGTSVTAAGQTESFHGYAGARAGTQGLGTFSNMDQFSYAYSGGGFANDGYIDGSFVSASASLHDTVTVLNAPTAASVKFTVVADGTFVCANSTPGGCTSASYLVPEPGAYLAFTSSTGGGIGPGLSGGKQTFTFTVPLYSPTFELGLTLNSYVEVASFLNYSNPFAISGSGTSDYYHSLNFDGYQILDNSNQVIPGASLQSDLGVNYAGPSATTPEPASVVMLYGAILLAFAILATRRKNKSA